MTGSQDGLRPADLLSNPFPKGLQADVGAPFTGGKLIEDTSQTVGFLGPAPRRSFTRTSMLGGSACGNRRLPRRSAGKE